MFKSPSSNRTKTQPGLGSGDGLPRIESSELKRDEECSGSGAPTTPRSASIPKRLRKSIRREEDTEPMPTARSNRTSDARTVSLVPELREREQSKRPPVTVDEVGVAAITIARRRRESTPKVVASRTLIAQAPIDTRAAFVLSLVDGRNTTSAIVDMSGMREDEVKAILDRLARLGLISLR